MTTVEEHDRQSVLARSVHEIRRLRGELAAAELARSEPIAIVGLACRMPGGAEDPEAFWEFLRAGGDGIGEVPASRWDAEAFYDPTPGAPGKMNTTRGGFLADVDRFDAAFFGISDREAAYLDPQQRLLLEVSWEALEHGGQRPDALTGSATGVFFGITTNDYVQTMLQQVDPADLEAYGLTGNASTFAAGRLSYWLGLNGPSLSVDTACSSSLVGLHLAVQSLRSGESSMALAGGVNVLLAPEWSVVAAKAHMLAPDGRCKTFAEAADGYVRSEGCGVVVLKRLSDAQAAGDRVLAVIRGSAVNQDGRSSGVTVPNPRAQQDVVRRALSTAMVSPDQVSYVEAHGTGTPLGDPLELRALDQVFGPARDGRDPLLVGSVKTNIGHLEPAAGVAGLIKVVLALQNEEIPPHLHLDRVNPEIGIEDLAVEIPTAGRPWPRGDRPRIAGVSSFGASGTNAHVVVAEAPAAVAPSLSAPAPIEPERTAHLLILSAKTPAALDALALRYRDRLAGADPAFVEDLCFTAATGRAGFPHRLAVSGSGPVDLAVGLSASAALGASAVQKDGIRPKGVWRGQVRAADASGVAFVFTGQGDQYPGMARTLYQTESVFRQFIDLCDELLREQLDRPLLSVLYPEDEADAELIHQTRYTQPALFAVEYALSELWGSWGVRPSAVLGHSVGELVAACVAGVMSLEDGLRLAAGRGRLMSELTPGGAMATVFATEPRVRERVEAMTGMVSIAAVNGPESVVVSGAEDEVQALLDAFAAEGVKSKRLTVECAFHSPLMDPMLEEFEQLARTIQFSAPRIPLLSNVTGAVLTGPDAFSPAYLREHVRAPVRFHDGMTALYGRGLRTFVEMGPAPTLVGMAKRFLPAGDERRATTLLPSLRKNHDDWAVLLDSVGALHTLGIAVDWDAFYQGRPRHKVSAPTYPFQRGRHWFRPSVRTTNAVASAGTTSAAGPTSEVGTKADSLLGQRVASPLDVIQFQTRLSPTVHECLGDCVMDGLPVVNIGVYLESAIEAARELHGTGPLVAEECLVLQSLVLDQEAPVNVQLLVEPDGNGGLGYGYYAEHPAGTSDADPEWVLHARGRIAPDPTPPAPEVDLTALRSDLTRETTGDDFYRQMSRRKLYLGPTARWIDHVWWTGGAALARLRPLAREDVRRYRLHPGLTDALFQALFVALPESTPAEATYMLVGLDSFRFRPDDGFDSLAPAYCHVRLLPTTDPDLLSAEVRLYDERGRTVVQADGVYLRRADRSQLQRTGADGRARPTGRVPARASSSPEASTGTAPARTPDDVRAIVLTTIAAALGSAAADLDPDESLQNLGLDSLMALEVKEALSAQLAVSLPMVAFLEGRSADALAEEVLSRMGLRDGAAAEAGQASGSGSSAGLPTLVVSEAERYEPFPLTDLQQAYLVGRSGAFELGDVSTYFFLEVDLDDLDLERLERALGAMIDRHDMLRAVVTPDGYQRVLPEVPAYRIKTVDLRSEQPDIREQSLHAIHEQMRDMVFDTALWPLFEIRATRVDDRTTRLHLGLDALIIDAWSTSLLFREWAAAYRDEELPDLPIRYRDYVLAARAVEGTELHAKSAAYWQERLDSLPPAPDLPLAKDPATVGKPVFSHRSGRLEAADWAAFKAHAAAAGVTPSAALCTAYAQVLAAWSKTSKFTLNVLFFNRLPLHAAVGQLVGNFSSTSLLEVDSTATDPFTVRAERTQHRLWTDLEHSHVSGVEVLRQRNRAGGGSLRAGMPVVFASTVNFAAKEDSAAATGLAWHLTSLTGGGREVSSSIRTPQVWLDHQVVQDADALIVNWDVVEEIFPAGMIDDMFAAYLAVLRDLCTDEASWQQPAPVLVPDAALADRRAANATAAPLPAGLLHEPFWIQAAAYPERTAVIAPDRELTYGELAERANRLGRWLRERGARPGALVGVVMEKGWEQIAAVLGVLVSGAAYVPIDAGVPAERLRLLLDSADISLVLTQRRVAERTSWPDGVSVLSVDSPQATDPSGAELPPSGAVASDLAYVIFTSGSTGLPKGVMIEHSGALNTVLDINARFGVGEDDRVLALSALNFDLSVYDVFGLLAAGGAIVLPEPGAHREPGRWLELVTEHGVTVWNTVPTLMEMFAEHALAAPDSGPVPVRVVMMSGDWIPVALPARIRTLLPSADLYSLGGATEAAIWSIYHPIGEGDPGWSSVPYGVPLLNQQFHVLDEAMRPCPEWVPGHLYIAGSGLARGYLGDERKTKASFVRHPSTGERLYRTGDLGRYRPGGIIEFLGREDFQVKVQGYRIELGEIEAALSRCPGVRTAVVTVLGARESAKQLAAYVVMDGGADPDADRGTLDKALRQMLPEYLVPQHIVLLDALPLSSNGKVDRSALPAVDQQAENDGDVVAPRDAQERMLADVWAEFFEAAPRSVHLNFFALGGDSLLAVRLMARIRAESGVALPLSVLFARPTIALLAEALRDRGEHGRRRALVPVRAEGDATPLFFVHPVGGDVLCYSELAGLLGAGQPFYALQTPDVDEPLETVEAMAAHYLKAITEAAPSGPYRIGGWSMGGVVALEIARQLTTAGHEVDLVAAVDLLEPPGPAPDDVDDAVLLSWFARDLAGLAGAVWEPDPDLFRGAGGTAEESLLFAEARRQGFLPEDIDEDTVQPILRRFLRNFRALLAHRPAAYDGEVLFLRASDGGATPETAAAWSDRLGGAVEIVDLPGDHFSVMRQPHLDSLADRLRDRLAVRLSAGHSAGLSAR
ncbi:amino acid adenylation domain-containing protein [Catenulispora sp. NL8]|uniref:Phenyloxazoline synthase MbtB n=1 Tax=Catenulispora pinistramenti TaxID=2705254 RepID=A0ABS5KTK9_9ACTN|nr:non-ribosomal peptide synthetase/type I polyketide synthase [Catenulispora pinistramenti]MBS2549392.1 amino acid adenylation domain-containing protein [Catenulispora pinistramenti]